MAKTKKNFDFVDLCGGFLQRAWNMTDQDIFVVLSTFYVADATKIMTTT